MQDFIERSIVDRLVRTLGVPDARLRVNLIVSYLLGIASTRTSSGSNRSRRCRG